MTQIKISIDCDEEYCGDCKYFWYNDTVQPSSQGYECRLLRASLSSVRLNDKMIPKYNRCPQCLAATVEE